MKKTLSVGVIGCGNIGAGIHMPILSSLKNVRIAFAADTRDPKEVARLYGVRGITLGEDLSKLPECDVLAIAAPVGAREPYMREYSRRGTAIFSEKPFAMNTKQHRAYLDMNKRMTCNYAAVYSNGVRQAKEIVRSKIFGRLREVVITEGGVIGKTGKGKDHYQTNIAMSGGGILIERGCHAVANTSFVLEGCTLKTATANIICKDQLDIDVEAQIDVKGPEQDAVIVYKNSYLRPFKNRTRFVFDHGIVEFDHANFEPPIVVSAMRNGTSFSLNPDPRWARTRKQAFHLKWTTFLKAVAGDLPIDVESETSLGATELIEDIYRTGGIWPK